MPRKSYEVRFADAVRKVIDEQNVDALSWMETIPLSGERAISLATRDGGEYFRYDIDPNSLHPSKCFYDWAEKVQEQCQPGMHDTSPWLVYRIVRIVMDEARKKLRLRVYA